MDECGIRTDCPDSFISKRFLKLFGMQFDHILMPRGSLVAEFLWFRPDKGHQDSDPTQNFYDTDQGSI